MMALWLLGCGSPCDPGRDPEVVIGTGDRAYAPLSDGDAVDIVYGSQGGYHVDLALDGSRFDGDDVVSASFVGRIGGDDVAFAEPWFTLTCNPESGTQQAWGIRLIFDGLIPPELDGRALDISGQVTDARGLTAEASRQVLLHDPY